MILSWDKGAVAVNLLFALAMLIKNNMFTCIAWGLWIIFVECFRKKMTSKAVRAVTMIFIAFTACMIGRNLYLMILCTLGN